MVVKWWQVGHTGMGCRLHQHALMRTAAIDALYWRWGPADHRRLLVNLLRWCGGGQEGAWARFDAGTLGAYEVVVLDVAPQATQV